MGAYFNGADGQVGICLHMGFVFKQSLEFLSNKYIPLMMAVLGLTINLAVNMSITADIVLGGLFSGLVSTGLNILFRNLIHRKQ